MAEAILEKPVHSQEFRFRRFLNWFPMGLTYAFLYMASYNLTVSKTALGDLMSKADFGIIFGAGTITYAYVSSLGSYTITPCIYQGSVLAGIPYADIAIFTITSTGTPC